MNSQIQSRKKMIRFLREEVMGPSAFGKKLPLDHQLQFEDMEEFYGPHIQQGSGNEIIKGESPRRRYGVGVLFPAGSPDSIRKEEDLDSGEPADMEVGRATDPDAAELPITEQAQKAIEKSQEKRSGGGATERDGAETEISLANQQRPSSMGISFLADLSPDSQLVVTLKAGRYRPFDACLKREEGKDRNSRWWFRSRVRGRAVFVGSDLLDTSGKIQPSDVKLTNAQGLCIDIAVLSRPLPDPGMAGENTRLLTVYVVNRSAKRVAADDEKGIGSALDAQCLFQVEFSARVRGVDDKGAILPYPERTIGIPDEEEQSLALLYRRMQTFATGHGCAADWGGETGVTDRMRCVRAAPMPVVELPSTTPDIFRDKARQDPLMVPMAPLAGLVDDDNGIGAATEVVDLYASWIDEHEDETTNLPPDMRPAAERHIALCRECRRRMTEGLDLIASDPTVRKAFQLANYAILLQQLRSSSRAVREMQFNEEECRMFFEAASIPDPLNPPKGRGQWRPFQLAFILMCLRSVADGKAPERETVELIWFPTGGGKTEAYLGLTAFALFHRRLSDPNDSGTHVLMRYTLRLLTAQQFQRAAGLLCAMEYIRQTRAANDLGPEPFSIGIWLGGETTPNTRADARSSWKALQNNAWNAEYNFVLLRCPWCGAQIGPVKAPHPARGSRSGRVRGRRQSATQRPSLIGLRRQGSTVLLHCPDTSCEFHSALPVFVIDEDIYEAPPSLVIGTVDKFAGLAWNSRARSLFGLDAAGDRVASPPGLIIQDELHLITGPLGSMAGLYETLIEELCTDRTASGAVKPKIVSSTATARRYGEQINALFARNESLLFPPPGLDISDSFFSSFARNEDGTLAPGRAYVGIHASSFPSNLTTNVRVYAALLQGARLLPEDQRDPWWTLLVFFNSLRELGTTLTLFQGDVPERVREICRRMNLRSSGEAAGGDSGKPPIRYLDRVLELTGRISSAEVPKAIASLEVPVGADKKPVDVCLASNIIEVGVDIDRLSLMTVVGQPKTTSQYIQVTGRVGRRWWERPGLVATILMPSKPRDRSHYERFRSYHERLYAAVEPTSVTPFTRQTLERALHSVLAGYVRQLGGPAEQGSPTPVPQDLLDTISAILKARSADVDPRATAEVATMLNLRLREWNAWERDRWDPGGNTEDPSLLRYASSYYPPIWYIRSWPTQTSMRAVDAECKPEITTLYLTPDLDTAEPTAEEAV